MVSSLDDFTVLDLEILDRYGPELRPEYAAAFRRGENVSWVGTLVGNYRVFRGLLPRRGIP
jgi:hypothetical protein